MIEAGHSGEEDRLLSVCRIKAEECRLMVTEDQGKASSHLARALEWEQLARVLEQAGSVEAPIGPANPGKPWRLR